LKTALKIIGVIVVCALAIATPEILPLWVAIVAAIIGW